MIEKCLKESLMPNCSPFLCNSDFCNYISRLLSFISYFDKMSLKSGLNTKCLHSREQDHLIWKHDFWEETFFPVMKMSNFVFRTSSDNSLRLTKYGVNALASWETIPPSFLQFGSIWVTHTHIHLLVCFQFNVEQQVIPLQSGLNYTTFHNDQISKRCKKGITVHSPL